MTALRPSHGFSGGDRTWIVLRGPEKPVPSRFYVAGRYQGKQGLELAPGLVGLDRPPSELVWLQEAHQNGADLVGNNIDVRTLKGAMNILGTSPRTTRAYYAAYQRAQSLERYSRLVFMNSYSGYRWLDFLYGEPPNASIDKEPVLRNGLIGYPFTWVCPNPYYKGRVEEFTDWKDLRVNALGRTYGDLRVRNLGDARTYPQIYLPGPGVWRIPQGARVDDSDEFVNPNDYVELPELKAGEEAWLDTDPRTETITKVDSQGVRTNMWAQMSGQRPRLHVPGERSEIWVLSVAGATPSTGKPKVVVQPLYTSYQ